MNLWRGWYELLFFTEMPTFTIVPKSLKHPFEVSPNISWTEDVLPEQIKPRGRPPQGKKWSSFGWVEDPDYKPKETSTKPRGRPPQGKKWSTESLEWIEDPDYKPKETSTKPRGRPPQGKKWSEESLEWIEDPDYKPKETSTKPRGRPPQGKKWCEESVTWIEDPDYKASESSSIKPTVQFQKKVDSSGKVRFYLKKIVVGEPQGEKTKKDGEPQGEKSKKETLKLNKSIHKYINSRKTKELKEALLNGGSLAYYNFEAIEEAAEGGHLDIFRVVFETVDLDYTRLVNKGLGKDLYEAALEEGHTKVAEYIDSKRGNLLTKIENQNLSGMNSFRG